MINKINSNITTSFLVFINDFGDISDVNKKELEKKAECKIDDLFKKQRNSDVAKKKLGLKDFNKAMALYFRQFINSSGLDAQALLKDLDKHNKVMSFHIKKDAMRYLKLMAQIGVSVIEKPKGLLAA